MMRALRFRRGRIIGLAGLHLAQDVEVQRMVADPCLRTSSMWAWRLHPLLPTPPLHPATISAVSRTSTAAAHETRDGRKAVPAGATAGAICATSAPKTWRNSRSRPPRPWRRPRPTNAHSARRARCRMPILARADRRDCIEARQSAQHRPALELAVGIGEAVVEEEIERDRGHDRSGLRHHETVACGQQRPQHRQVDEDAQSADHQNLSSWTGTKRPIVFSASSSAYSAMTRADLARPLRGCGIDRNFRDAAASETTPICRPIS